LASEREKDDYVASLTCPWCGKGFAVIKHTKVTQPAVKAEKEVEYRAEKETQTKLGE